MKLQILTGMLILLALGCAQETADQGVEIRDASERDTVLPESVPAPETEASDMEIAVPQFCNDMSEYTAHLRIVNQSVPAFTDGFREIGAQRWREEVLRTYTRQNEADVFEREVLAPMQVELQACTGDCEAKEQNIIRLQGVLREIRQEVAAEMEGFEISYAPICEPLSVQECVALSTGMYKTTSPLDCTGEQFVCKEIKRVSDKVTGETLVMREMFRDDKQEFLIIVDKDAAVANAVCSQTF